MENVTYCTHTHTYLLPHAPTHTHQLMASQETCCHTRSAHLRLLLFISHFQCPHPQSTCDGGILFCLSNSLLVLSSPLSLSALQCHHSCLCCALSVDPKTFCHPLVVLTPLLLTERALTVLFSPLHKHTHTQTLGNGSIVTSTKCLAVT